MRLHSYLTITSTDTDSSICPDLDGVHCGKSQKGVVGDSREGWKSTVCGTDTAKMLLRTVRDSENAFPPLKSVAVYLCNILENYEAQFPEPLCRESSPRAQGNKRAIESLAPRVKLLAESLCTPISEGDTREESRRMSLKQ